MEADEMAVPLTVKSEQDYGNQQILLFYVDEGGGNEQSIVTTMENIHQSVPIEETQNYYIDETAMDTESDNNYIVMDASSIIVDSPIYADVGDNWSETEVKRLLVFYIDNKDTFLKGETKENFLWSVACKTMLMGKTPPACQVKLESLRNKYNEILQKHSFHVTTEKDVQWPYFVLAHQAFHNEVGESNCVNEVSNENLTDNTSYILGATLYDVGDANILKDEQPVVTNKMRVRECNERNETLIIKKPASNEQCSVTKHMADPAVLMMLDLYLQLQNVDNLDTKTKWEVISSKLGDEKPEYLHKRFLNFRRHYITLLEKHKNDHDHSNISWPYMDIFNQIFKDDEKFHQKYNFEEVANTEEENIVEVMIETPVKPTWSNPEKVILVKHYFDCYDEHNDPTLPKQFLWTEIGRLLDKNPLDCKSTYEELRSNHLDKYIKGGYNKSDRDPLSILYDHIISMDVENKISHLKVKARAIGTFNNNDMIEFFYNNLELFKDEMCYYVCWAAICHKLKASLRSCLSNWYSLKAEYRLILNQRNNEQSPPVEWEYKDKFDKIFDFGADIKMFHGYENSIEESQSVDELDITEPDIKETPRQDIETNITKILDYYRTHQEKFLDSSHNQTFWRDLSKEIGLTNRRCANLFEDIKKEYLTLLSSSEMDESTNVSAWRHYETCKEIFGSKQMQPKPKIRKKKEKVLYAKEEPKISAASEKSVKIKKWTEKSRELLLTLYLRQLKSHRNKTIDSHKMWREISIKLNRQPEQCKKMFVKLKRLNQSSTANSKYKELIDEILSIKANFHHPVVVSKKRMDYKNFEIPLDKLEKALEYYLKNLEEFVSEKYSKRHAWRQLSKDIDEPVYKLYQTINYLKTNYTKLKDSSYAIILNLILEKEKEVLKNAVKITGKRGRNKQWTVNEKVKLNELYTGYKVKFSNPKYSKKYLWYEIGLSLNRGYKECQKEFSLLRYLI